MSSRIRLLARPRHEIQPSPLARFLFTDSRAAWIWLVVRIYLGYQWLEAGWSKITNPAWMDGGAALKGFWASAITIPEAGRPPIAFDWYRAGLSWMLEQGFHPWFAKLVAYGEFLVGVRLIFGAFVGLAAFFGAFMNWNYIMAGAASTNGLLLVLAMLLILAWRIAGYIGLDYYLIPFLGTPWQRKAARVSEPPQTA